MFGLQAAKLKNLFRDVPEGDRIVDTVSDCEAELEHSGPVTLNGPVNVPGSGVFGKSGVLLLDPKLGATTINGYTINQIFGTPGIGGGVALGTPGAIKGTLAAALARDGTATLNLAGGGTATVSGYFVKSGYKIPSGQRVGAISFDGGATFDVIVNDDCLEPA